jgi:chlorobactene glucosyltransferase
MGPIGLSISIALMVIAAILAARLKSRYFRGVLDRHRFKPSNLASGPLVSVVIPARNEESSIGALFAGVSAQTYRSIEVIVVNDASTDSTASIVADRAASDPRVCLIQAPPVPAGWTGKCNACRAGVALAKGEFLLFLDCDVRLTDTGVIGGLVEHARANKIDLLSIVPRQVLATFTERFLLPAVYTIMALRFLPYGEVNDPAKPKAAAVGQCMLFRREAYDAAGGHEAVRGQIAEDMGFALIVKSSGMRLVLLDGGDFLSVRMYRSLGEIWHGWTKHLYLSASRGFGGFVAQEVTFALVFVAPLVVLTLSLASMIAHPSLYPVVPILFSFGMEAYGFMPRLRIYRAMKWPPRYMLLFAPAMVFALVLLAASAVKHVLPGGLSWKGRRYSASELGA